ncbi:MAG: hypothetical protein H0V92_11725 [Pseudonocardiales bacterium]|nr:hypothetical protein [Pseudonocardiales bacterium]
MRDRMARDLMVAVKARDTTAVAALRSALAAIDNAGAVASGHDQQYPVTTEHLAGAVAGLGATEVERRVVSDGKIRGLLQSHVDEWTTAADGLSLLGRHDRARQLRAEADVLRRYLVALE